MGKWTFRFLVLNTTLLFFIVIKCGKNLQYRPNTDTIIVPIHQVMSGEPIVLAQNDDRIINFIWEKGYIVPPSKFDYNLEKPEKDPSRGQGQFIRKLLRNKIGGFFVEAGALDGETRSNTLFLEKYLDWKGLIVEGDPSNYKILKTKNRKAWSSNTCLAIKPYPHKTEYLQHFNTGKILTEKSSALKANTTRVQCMPLFSLLSALNVTEVDYFSLDVEGSELDVLKTIPFDKVLIKTLSVEFEHTRGGKQGILDFMKSNGYHLVGEITPPRYSWANDVILAHNTVLQI